MKNKEVPHETKYALTFCSVQAVISSESITVQGPVVHMVVRKVDSAIHRG